MPNPIIVSVIEKKSIDKIKSKNFLLNPYILSQNVYKPKRFLNTNKGR